jgi:hypothetical protein
MTTASFELGDGDIRRIAEAIASILGQPSPHRWLDVKKASEYTSLTPEALRTAAKRGRLPGHRGPSGRLVFRTSELDDYMGGS